MKLTDKKKISIISAAKDNFLLFGYDGVNMTKVATDAGVSKRTLYRHFASKETLFYAILEDVLDDALSYVSTPYSSEEPLLPQVEKIIERHLNMLSDNYYSGFYRMYLPRALYSKDDRERFQKSLTEWPSHTWLKAAINDQRIQALNVEILDAHLTAMIQTLVFWPNLINGETKVSANELAELIKSTAKDFVDKFGLRD